MKAWALGLAVLTLLASALAPGRGAAEETQDEKLLKEVGIGVGGDELAAFFRKRTPTEAEIKTLIGRLSDEDYDEREKASRLLREWGSAAAPFLKAALKSSNPEVANRAKLCLAVVEANPWPRVPMAAARLLAQKAPPGAVPALLDYLPFAGDLLVEDEVLATLLALTPEAGKADSALTAALRATSPVKRAAAAYVLGRKGDKEQTAEVRKLLSDKDPKVRWRTALALLASHDQAAPPALIELLDDGPAELAWEAEEVLLRMGGDKAPVPVSDDDDARRKRPDLYLGIGGKAPPPISAAQIADARRKRREQWAAWWKENADKIDLTYYNDYDHPLGYTLGVEYNTGRVWECAADGALRWELRDLAGPMDAQVLPNGRVLVAEAGSRTVAERDLKGDVLWEKKLDVEPTGCRRLGNGNTFVSALDRVMEFAPDGSLVYSFKLVSGVKGSNAVHKHRNGHIIKRLFGKPGQL